MTIRCQSASTAGARGAAQDRASPGQLSNCRNGRRVPQRQPLPREDLMFQIVRLTLDDKDDIAVRRPLKPLFELREDAMAMPEVHAARLLRRYAREDGRG